MRELTKNDNCQNNKAQKVVELSNKESLHIKPLEDVVTCLRTELNKDLPLQHVALLLAVVQQPGISMQGLMDKLNMPQGSVSRNVKLLSEQGRGYGLLYTSQCPVNRKQVMVSPTQKAISLIEKLCKFIHVQWSEEGSRACQCSGAH